MISSKKTDCHEEGSDYKGTETSGTSKQGDSAYGSNDTSQWNRSSSSSKSRSHGSKSSTSGSSQPTTGSATPFTYKFSKGKKSKSKSKDSKQPQLQQPVGELTGSGAPSGADGAVVSGNASLPVGSVPVSTSGIKNSSSSDSGAGGSTPSSSAQDEKAHKVAVLSQALEHLDKYRKSKELKEERSGFPGASELANLATNLQEVSRGAKNPGLKAPLPEQSGFEVNERISDPLQEDQLGKSGDGFCAAVSLNDGMVMHTTDTITGVLGYPKDMWIGRSFIDFVHPKDRGTFTNQIAKGITQPFGNKLKNRQLNEFDDWRIVSNLRTSPGMSKTFFCRLRHYNGLNQGRFSIKNRKKVYHPFKLSVWFKELSQPSDHASSSEEDLPTAMDASKPKQGVQSVCLIVTAISLNSAYLQRDQAGPFECSFVTRHSSNCVWTLVEESAIPFLGYLPQDIEGVEIFQYYHPQDLPYLKEVYQSVMKEQGKPFKSRPYRFKVQNGGYVLLETDWSCFINPWTRKLEFVIGKHVVLKGPTNPNVFCAPEEEDRKTNPEEIPKETKKVQDDIRQLFEETVSCVQKTETSSKTHSKRRKQLASFMGTLLEEMAKAEAAAHVGSEEADASVVLGNISPHHENLSSETPPSYNQLNYNDNLSRFFNSQPKTLSEREARDNEVCIEEGASNPAGESGLDSHDASDSSGKNRSGSSGKSKRPDTTQGKGEKSKNSGANNDPMDSTGDSNQSGENRIGDGTGSGGDGSGSGTGSGNSGRSSGSKGHSSDRTKDKYKPPVLTEEILLVHNRGMEKKMIEMYKDSKKTGLKFVKNQLKTRDRGQNRNRMKRHHKLAWNLDKQLYNPSGAVQRNVSSNHRDCQGADNTSTSNPITSGTYGINQVPGNPSNLHLWPPFTMAGPPFPLQIKGSNRDPSQTCFIPPGASGAMPSCSMTGPLNAATSGALQQVSSVTTALYHNLIPVYIPASLSQQMTLVDSRAGPGVGANSTATKNVAKGQQKQPQLTQPLPAHPHPGPSRFYVPTGPGQFLSQQFIQPGVAPSILLQPLEQYVPAAVLTSSTLRRGAPEGSEQVVEASPDLPDSVSVDSCISGQQMELGRRNEKTSTSHHQPRSSISQASTKFRRPTSRAGSRNTSIKAEPGSALESNASASLKDKQLLSPGFKDPRAEKRTGFALNSDNSGSDSGSGSSLYSLLKSSDDFVITTGDSANSSGEAENEQARPQLQKPFWLQNVEITPELIYGYQIKTRNMVEVLKDDLERLKKMYQPSLVNEQLSDLFKEMEEQGVKPNGLLECSQSNSDSSSSSSESEAADTDDDQKIKSNKKAELLKENKFHKFSRIFEADSPLPPPIGSFQKSKNRGTDTENKSSSDMDKSVTTVDKMSTSLGSSSAITVDIKSSSNSESEQTKAKSDKENPPKASDDLASSKSNSRAPRDSSFSDMSWSSDSDFRGKPSTSANTTQARKEEKTKQSGSDSGPGMRSSEKTSRSAQKKKRDPSVSVTGMEIENCLSPTSPPVVSVSSMG